MNLTESLSDTTQMDQFDIKKYSEASNPLAEDAPPITKINIQAGTQAGTESEIETETESTETESTESTESTETESTDTDTDNQNMDAEPESPIEEIVLTPTSQLLSNQSGGAKIAVLDPDLDVDDKVPGDVEEEEDLGEEIEEDLGEEIEDLGEEIEEDLGEEIDDDLEEFDFAALEDLVMGEAEFVTVSETREVQAAPDTRQFEKVLFAPAITDLVTRHYSGADARTKQYIIDTYLRLYEEAAELEKIPPRLQRAHPLVRHYHDGKFTQDWLVPVLGDLKRTFSANTRKYGERIFQDKISGANAVLDTIDKLSKLIGTTDAQQRRDASQKIANELRAYFPDTKDTEDLFRTIPEDLIGEEVIYIEPKGKLGQYMVETCRFHPEMEEIIERGEAEQPEASEVRFGSNKSEFLFDRAQELEIKRFDNEFIEGLYEIQDANAIYEPTTRITGRDTQSGIDKEDGQKSRKTRRRKGKSTYSKTTPLSERILKGLKEATHPAVEGQKANVRGYLRRPLFPVPSAFQLWYLNAIASGDRKALMNPQENWLHLDPVEALPYHQEHERLLDEHTKAAKFIMVPFDTFMKRPGDRRWSLLNTWRDSYVIFLLPNRKMYTLDQAVEALDSHVNVMSPKISTRIYDQYADVSEIVKDEASLRAFLNLEENRDIQIKDLEKLYADLPVIQSFRQYIEFLENIVGSYSDMLQIHRDRRTLSQESLQRLTNAGITESGDAKRGGRYTSLFGLNPILEKFDLDLRSIPVKYLENIQRPLPGAEKRNRESLLRSYRELSRMLMRPGNLKPPLDPSSELSKDGIFKNELLVKGYGAYPFFGQFKDSLQARISWVMHSPDQGNLFFTILRYHNLLKLLQFLDQDLLPKQWTDSDTISYRQVLMHIEETDHWRQDERITEQNWTDLPQIQDIKTDDSPLNWRESELEEVRKALEIAKEEFVNNNSFDCPKDFRGQYYIGSGDKELDKICYWYGPHETESGDKLPQDKCYNPPQGRPDDRNGGEGDGDGDRDRNGGEQGRYWNKKTYLLILERDALEKGIADFQELRKFYVDFPEHLREAYQKILLAQNKALSLRNQAQRPHMFDTMDTDIEDSEIQVQEISPFKLKLRQISAIENPERRRRMIKDLFERETKTDGKRLFTKEGETFCTHELDQALGMSTEDLLKKYATEDGETCDICGERIAPEEYDPLIWDKENNRPMMGEGTILLTDLGDIQDKRIIDHCLTVLQPDAEITAESQYQPKAFSELENWICQTLKKILGNDRLGFLETQLDEIIPLFQDYLESDPINPDRDNTELKRDINQVTEQERERFSSDISEKIRTEILETDNLLTRAREALEKTKQKAKEQGKKVSPKILTKFNNAIKTFEKKKKDLTTELRQTIGDSIKLERYVRRYLLLVRAIINTLESEGTSPDAIMTIVAGGGANGGSVNGILGQIANLASSYKGQEGEPLLETKDLDKLIFSNNLTYKDQVMKFLDDLKEENEEYVEAIQKAKQRFSELGQLTRTQQNLLYDWNPDIAEKLKTRVENADTVYDSGKILNGDLRLISQRIERTLAQIYEDLDQYLGRQVSLNKNAGNLERGVTECYADIRQYYMEAILSRLLEDYRQTMEQKGHLTRQTLGPMDFKDQNQRNAPNDLYLNPGTDESLTRIPQQLDSLMNSEKFPQESLERMVDQLEALETMALRLENIRYHNWNASTPILPNLLPYDRADKKTYLSMKTTAEESKAFPKAEVILGPSEIEKVKQAPKECDEDRIQNALSENIVEAYPTGKTQDELLKIIRDIGQMNEKRRAELTAARNPLFERKKDEAYQIALHQNQLYKSLIVDYCRFYISFFTNWTVSGESDEVEAQFREAREHFPKFFPNEDDFLLNFAEGSDLEVLKKVLKGFQREVPNSGIDRTYVYTSTRYGDGALMVPINQDRIRAGFPPIISEKLAEFWNTRRGQDKCYQSFSDAKSIDAATLESFMRCVLFNDLLQHYNSDSLKGYSGVIPKERRVYSMFLQELLELLLKVTNLKFQAAADATHLNNLRLHKAYKKRSKNPPPRDSLSNALMIAGLTKVNEARAGPGTELLPADDGEGEGEGEGLQPYERSEEKEIPPGSSGVEEYAGYGIGDREFANEFETDSYFDPDDPFEAM